MRSAVARSCGVAFGPPEFVKLAEPCGATGCRIDPGPWIWAPLCKGVLEAAGPVVPEVPSDCRDHSGRVATVEASALLCPRRIPFMAIDDAFIRAFGPDDAAICLTRAAEIPVYFSFRRSAGRSKASTTVQ